MKNTYRAARGGFTLVELLIVIAIIGILAGTILVSLNSSRAKALNVKVQAEITQARTQLEQGLANNAYLDLAGTATHVDQLATTTAGYDNLTTLFCDIGKLNGYASTVPNDVALSCEGVPGQHTGVVIYSSTVGWNVSDYGIYATTTPGGYVCIDSYGNSQSTTSASIPNFASIASPSLALCQ